MTEVCAVWLLSCSYEARKYGVISGIPMWMAHQLHPDILVLKGDIQRSPVTFRIKLTCIRSLSHPTSAISLFKLDYTLYRF